MKSHFAADLVKFHLVDLSKLLQQILSMLYAYELFYQLELGCHTLIRHINLVHLLLHSKILANIHLGKHRRQYESTTLNTST